MPTFKFDEVRWKVEFCEDIEIEANSVTEAEKDLLTFIHDGVSGMPLFNGEYEANFDTDMVDWDDAPTLEWHLSDFDNLYELLEFLTEHASAIDGLRDLIPLPVSLCALKKYGTIIVNWAVAKSEREVARSRLKGALGVGVHTESMTREEKMVNGIITAAEKGLEK